MSGQARPVRVTIDGTARPLEHSPGKLRIEAHGLGVIVVDEGALDVTVEYLEAPRDWRDQDAVAGRGSVWTRVGGKWHSVTEHGVSTAFDADIDAGVLAGQYRVLQYQAGDR